MKRDCEAKGERNLSAIWHCKLFNQNAFHARRCHCSLLFSFVFTLVALTFPSSGRAQPAARVSWAGPPTPTSVRLAVQPTKETATVLVSTRSDLASPVARLAVTKDAFVVDVEGLIPESQYYYGIDSMTAEEVGTFRTPASKRGAFRIAVGACSWSRENGAVFANIAALKPQPLVFIHAGDLFYGDIAENDMQRYDTAFHRIHAAEQRHVFRAMPTMYIWDDHDFGPNNADGSSLSKPAALAAFRKYVPATVAVEKSQLPTQSVTSAGVFQSYEIQGVLFIVTDLRSQSNARARPGTTLGEEQKKWLLGLLARWQEWRLIIWVSSKPWLGVEGVDGDDWSAYAAERLAISDAIASAGVRNLIMVAGDAHMLAVDDGSNTDFSTLAGIAKGNSTARAGFPLFQVAPLTGYGSSKSGPYSHGCWGYQYFVNHHFGIVDVDDGDSSSVCVSFKGMTAAGTTAGLEFKVCAGETDGGGTRGIIKKGTRSQVEASQCRLPLAPDGMIAMLAIGILSVGLAIIVDVVCVWQLVGNTESGKPFATLPPQSATPRPSPPSTAHTEAAPPAAPAPVAASQWSLRSPFVLGVVALHLLGIILVSASVGMALGPGQYKS